MILQLFCWQVVYLASESFHYRFNDRCDIHMRRFATEQWPDTIGKRVSNDLPLKVRGAFTTRTKCVGVSYQRNAVGTCSAALA